MVLIKSLVAITLTKLQRFESRANAYKVNIPEANFSSFLSQICEPYTTERAHAGT